jgi:6-phosphogluconolactonase
MVSLRLFIGTYTHHGGKGIYALQLDGTTGELGPPLVAAVTPSPSYLAFSPDRTTLYAVSETEAMAVAFRVQSDRTHLSPLPTRQQAGGTAPCHLTVDHTGRVLLVVNYHTGVVASFPIQPDGTLAPAASIIQHHGSGVDPERQASPHAHSVTVSPDNRFALVCDLGLDKIFTYRLDSVTATLAPAEPPYAATAPGSGPRHFAFSLNGQHAFVITEMGGTLTSYLYGPEHGTLKEIDSQSTLPKDFRGENKSAAVRVHPNGHFVYASNRGPDSIAVFSFDSASGRLTLVEIVPSGGKAPRDFALSPDGNWLVAAHQDSNSLTVLRVSPETGRLTRTMASAEISMPVCVLFAD